MLMHKYNEQTQHLYNLLRGFPSVFKHFFNLNMNIQCLLTVINPDWCSHPPRPYLSDICTRSFTDLTCPLDFFRYLWVTNDQIVLLTFNMVRLAAKSDLSSFPCLSASWVSTVSAFNILNEPDIYEGKA